MRIQNKRIDTDIEDIIYDIKKETNYFDKVKNTHTHLMLSCPFHGDGHEKHPSLEFFFKIL